MTDRLTEIKRQALQNKVGAPATMPLGELEKTYISSKTTIGKTESIPVAEQKMLIQIITNNGGTPTSKYTSDLLKQALGALGVTPTKQLNQNWKLLYKVLP